MCFPVVMYGYESWTIKKAEHGRIDAFELWCWRRLLRVPRTARRWRLVNTKGNQPWIFTERTDAEAPILWPCDLKSQLTGKDPNAGKDRRQEKGMTEDEMVGCITNSMDMSLNKLQETVKDREAWRVAVHGVTRSRTEQPPPSHIHPSSFPQ